MWNGYFLRCLLILADRVTVQNERVATRSDLFFVFTGFGPRPPADGKGQRDCGRCSAAGRRVVLACRSPGYWGFVLRAADAEAPESTTGIAQMIFPGDRSAAASGRCLCRTPVSRPTSPDLQRSSVMRRRNLVRRRRRRISSAMKIGFLGCGKMAQALAKGFIAGGPQIALSLACPRPNPLPHGSR